MIAVMDWTQLGVRYPMETAMRDAIIEFVSSRPGCTFNGIEGHLKPMNREGLQAVILRMRDDGDIVSVGPHPVEAYYPKGADRHD